MAISDSNNMVMPVSPMGEGGFGGFGGDGWWIILFLFALMGFGGNGFGMGNNGFAPYYFANNTDNGVQAGFNNAALTSQLTGIQNSINTGFATSEVADCGRAMDNMQTAYGNQIASMNQRFMDTTALTGQLNNLAMGLQNCCCENRASIADLKYTVATEACADRATVNNALRDVITANTASTQRILDQMCQDRIDAKNEKIADLERQLTLASLSASQTAQTATILANNDAQTSVLEKYLAPVPIPAYIVANPTSRTATF